MWCDEVTDERCVQNNPPGTFVCSTRAARHMDLCVCVSVREPVLSEDTIGASVKS